MFGTRLNDKDYHFDLFSVSGYVAIVFSGLLLFELGPLLKRRGYPIWAIAVQAIGGFGLAICAYAILLNGHL